MYALGIKAVLVPEESLSILIVFLLFLSDQAEKHVKTKYEEFFFLIHFQFYRMER